MVFVEDQGFGNVSEAPSPQVQSPTEIDIFEEHEVALVESPEFLENCAAHEHSRPRAEQHVSRLGQVMRYPLARKRLVSHPEPGQSGADVVDEPTFPVKDPARDRANTR
jgi:hypothetical protein